MGARPGSAGTDTAGVKPQGQRRHMPTREATKSDVNPSDDEGECSYYNLRLLPMYESRAVRHHPHQPKLHSELRAGAPEYQPLSRSPESEYVWRPGPSDPLVTAESMPVPRGVDPSPAVEGPDQHRDDVMESGSSQDPEIDVVPVLQPVREVDQQLRRSTRQSNPETSSCMTSQENLPTSLGEWELMPCTVPLLSCWPTQCFMRDATILPQLYGLMVELILPI